MAVLTALWGRTYAALFGNLQYGRRIGVTIGSGCRILTRRFGSEPHLITIGDRAVLSRDVWFYTHDGSTDMFRDNKGRRYRYGRITLGNDVFIGAHTILLPGIRIGDRVIVGAGSVVARSIPDGMVVAGNPARIIGTYDDLAMRRLTDSPAKSDLPSDIAALTHAHMMPLQPMMVTPDRFAPKDRPAD